MLPPVTRLKTFLAVVVLAVALVPVPMALATAEPEPETPATTEAPTDPRLQPAVVVGGEAEATEDEAWTFRFLVPTVLAIAAAGVVVTLLVYGVRVRGRYRVVR
jgi:hypothetical protein